jgi:outer membrane protein assembly factor BamD
MVGLMGKIGRAMVASFQRNASRWTSFAGPLLLLLSLLTLPQGCSLYEQLFGREEEKDAAELMTEGMENLDRGYYKSAVESFQKIRDRYPYSRFAITAELKMADALYLTEEYDQAHEAYDEFEKLHPKHKEIPYVVYQKGMCQFRQVKSEDREQVHTFKAKEEFERVISRFPRDEFAERARKNLRQCFIYLADYELYVAHFYFKKGRYRAALARYTYVIETYPDLGQYHEALEYISKCKEKLAQEMVQDGSRKTRWPFSIWK